MKWSLAMRAVLGRSSLGVLEIKVKENLKELDRMSVSGKHRPSPYILCGYKKGEPLEKLVSSFFGGKLCTVAKIGAKRDLPNFSRYLMGDLAVHQIPCSKSRVFPSNTVHLHNRGLLEKQA